VTGVVLFAVFGADLLGTEEKRTDFRSKHNTRERDPWTSQQGTVSILDFLDGRIQASLFQRVTKKNIVRRYGN